MAKRNVINKEKFIKDATDLYGNEFDYSLIESVTSKTQNVPVICTKHGVFYTNYNRFIKEQTKCPKCRVKVKWTEELAKEKIKEIHGDKYDMSQMVFKNSKTKFKLICPEHGEFYIDLEHILRMQGCPKCRYIKSANSTRRTIEEVLNECKEVHGDKYDYSLITEYKNDRIKYPIVCKDHGIFYQTMNNHIKGGQGCPECGKIQCAESRKISFEEFEKRANEVHNNKYTYDKTTYISTTEKTKITCPIHGDFWQEVSNHLFGQGCPTCRYKIVADKQRLTQDEFIERARKTQGDKYDYSKVKYIDYNTKVCIICPKHGEFWQTPGNHIYGFGCPSCAPLESSIEDEIYDFVTKELGLKCFKRDRIILKGKEIDLYFPDYKIGIEVDGLYWHSEITKDKNYHLEKTETCEKQGIRLIHIFEDEWVDKSEIVKSMLRNLFNKTENKIFARKCVIREVDAKTTTRFLEENHVQGRCPSNVKIGLYYNDELVSLMTFGKSRHFIGNGKTEWELIRFCNKINTTVVGGASKLFKHFIKIYDPKEIVTYADKRWSKGKLYNQLGFTKYNESRPNYYYVIGRKRHYRFNYRKSILVKKYSCPEEMSEHEFCLSKKWYRIYDCGNYCFRWKNN